MRPGRIERPSDRTTVAPRPGVPNEVLKRLYRDPSTDSYISPDFATALYQLVHRERPRASCSRSGWLHGASALAILTALEQNEVGQLISIDPHQSSTGRGRRGAGTANIEAAGMAHRHRLIEEPDYLALPDLVRAGTRVQLVYIDGWHTFDYDCSISSTPTSCSTSAGWSGSTTVIIPRSNVYSGSSFDIGTIGEANVGLQRRKIVRRRGWLPLARWTGRRSNAVDQYFRKWTSGAQLRLLGRVLSGSRSRVDGSEGAVEVALPLCLMPSGVRRSSVVATGSEFVASCVHTVAACWCCR